MLKPSVWNKLEPFFQGKVLLFAWVYPMFLHYKIHRRNKSYWQFWACQCIWQCKDMSELLREYWFNWRYIIKVWVFLWTCRRVWLWWQLTVWFSCVQLCIPYHKHLLPVGPALSSFQLSCPCLLIIISIKI